MKKTLLFLAAISIAVAANAKILRVSNVSGSSAPYTSIDAAHDAASAGDTIMVDGSSAKYGGTNGKYDITKKLVIIGPGYWLVENDVIAEGSSSASVATLNLKTTGIVVKGMEIGHLNIYGAMAVINRCQIVELNFKAGSDNGVITQCFITGTVAGASQEETNYVQMTNNIFTSNTVNHIFANFINSYIAYNTFRNKNVKFYNNVKNTTIEHNLWKECTDSGSGNSFRDNYETDIISTQATNDFIDSDYYNLEIPEEVTTKYGAFAGDSPYIMSGVPSGPVIQDLVVPTTVEMGTKMNVTIKVGMIK